MISFLIEAIALLFLIDLPLESPRDCDRIFVGIAFKKFRAVQGGDRRNSEGLSERCIEKAVPLLLSERPGILKLVADFPSALLQRARRRQQPNYFLRTVTP